MGTRLGFLPYRTKERSTAISDIAYATCLSSQCGRSPSSTAEHRACRGNGPEQRARRERRHPSRVSLARMLRLCCFSGEQADHFYRDSLTTKNEESPPRSEEPTQKSATGKINPEVAGSVRHPAAPPPLQVPAKSEHAAWPLPPPSQDTDPTRSSPEQSVKVPWKLGTEYAAQLKCV